MPIAIRLRTSPAGARPSRRRMSIAVTMRPRKLSTPAISGGASGTRVSRSSTKTSCTRAIGRPNNWPPTVAVTYSVMVSSMLVKTLPSRRAVHVGGLLLERRDETLAVELGHVIVQTDLASALDQFHGHQRRKPDDRYRCGARIAAHRRGQLEAVHAGHVDIGDDDVDTHAVPQHAQRFLGRS